MYIFVSPFPRRNSRRFFTSFWAAHRRRSTKREPPFLLPPSITLSLQHVPWLCPLRLPLVHVPVTIQAWTRNICPSVARVLSTRTVDNYFQWKRGTRKNSGEPFSRSASTIGHNEFGSSAPRGIDTLPTQIVSLVSRDRLCFSWWIFFFFSFLRILSLWQFVYRRITIIEFSHLELIARVKIDRSFWNMRGWLI